MSTTWNPRNLRPEDYPHHQEWWTQDEFYAAWVYLYFHAIGTPSARGGFEEAATYDTLYACRACGAVVFEDGVAPEVGFLNVHRAWHDNH